MEPGDGGSAPPSGAGGGFAGMPSPSPADGTAPDLEGADSIMSWVSAAISTPFVFLQTYGWVVVGVLLLCYLIWTRVRERFYELYDRTMENHAAANTDPSVVVARQEALAAARDRMQRQLDEQAALYAEKQRADEERKRQDKVEDWDRHQRGDGYRSRVKKPDETATDKSKKPKPKSTLRENDYNPLTGDGGSGGAFQRASGRHSFRSSGGG